LKTELPLFSDVTTFVSALKELHTTRERNKVTSKRQILTSKERKQVLEKTDARCHVCGIELSTNFQADHVKCHSSGGDHNVANYLPACKLCNNYRWNYSAEELQWIIKLGVWTKTQIENETAIGKALAEKFVQHESRREKRRRNPRFS
jgi:hypothetical protein